LLSEFDLAADKEVVRIHSAHDAAIAAIETSKSFSFISGSWDRTIKAWDTRASTSKPVSFCHAGAKIWKMAISTDGQTLVAATSKKKVRGHQTSSVFFLLAFIL
jgi:WD40 repeat protein